MSNTYTEYGRRLIAGEGYNEDLRKGSTVDIGTEEHPRPIGTVRKVATNKTGLKAYVVESPDKKEVTVLYQGSVCSGQCERYI
ncbi:hypothetical protein A6J72_08765 [Streptococcus intermedius]|nr:hypothetical protein [Streptococcus intermedius]ARC27251.1 hypothetical protein A6J72_08765 [Streptococcus intermedius]